PARHVGGDGATAIAALRVEREHLDWALSNEAVRKSCSVDDRRTPAAFNQGARDLRQGGIQGRCEPRADRDGTRDQRLKAWLPFRSGERKPCHLRRTRLRLATLGVRQWIGQPGSGQRVPTCRPRHEYSRSTSASTQRHGREKERT